MQEDTPTSVASGQGQWTRVVVLAPPPDPGQAGPERSAGPGVTADAVSSTLSETLRAIFTARDWFPIVQHDPYLAFAELSLRDRAQTARSTWGLQRLEQIALVILSPSAWQESILNDLVSAIHHYLPTISIWRAEHDRVEAMNGRTDGDDSATGLSASVAAEPVVVSSPRSPQMSPTAISREEIDMLLRGDGAGVWLPASPEVQP